MIGRILVGNRALSLFAMILVLTVGNSTSRAEDELGKGSRADGRARAQDGFAAWANGKWLDYVVLPAGHSRWGTWQEIEKRAEEEVRAIVLEAAYGQNSESDLATERSGLFYRCAMDANRCCGVHLETNALVWYGFQCLLGEEREWNV
jgi:hypothetical protein